MKTSTTSSIWGRFKNGRIADLLVGHGAADDIENRIGMDRLLQYQVSIAVLPFESTDRQDKEAYFCEGMAEEILNTLARIPGLRVVSRLASFCFGGDHDVRLVGQKLDVDTVLLGTVEKSVTGLQVSASLLDTRDGREIWSEQLDRPPGDIGQVQHAIASGVAGALGLVVQDNPDASQLPVDYTAYDLFLRGLSYFSRHTTQDIVYARQMLKQALEIEPGYGRAWAGVAYTHGFEYMYFNASNVNLAEMQRTSRKALKLAPDLAQSHIAAGIAHCMNQDHKKTEKAFTRAIRLNPFNFHAWYFYGRSKVHEGDLERALKLFDFAARVRPEDFQSVLLQAQLHISLKQERAAIEVTSEGMKRVRAALDLNPGDNRALNMGAFALLRLGEEKEAGDWMLKSLMNAPMDSIIQYNGACFFSLAGDVERALDCLENCLIKVGNINREWLVHDSDMDNIRSHPRFAKIISTFPG